jgi:hypothetical protein
MRYIKFVLSIMLLGIATAWAVPPEMYSYTVYYDSCPGEPDNYPLYNCGGGLFVCEVLDFPKVVDRTFFDKNGEMVRFSSWATGEGGFYELGNPDNFLPYKHITQTFEYDVARDISSMTGPVGLIIVPGQGLIFQSVGRITAEGLGIYPPFTLEAGRHDWFRANSFGEVNEAVCDYLASP